MRLETAAQSDVGLVRPNNEDRVLCAPELRLFAVADGIGGLPCGGEMAAAAVQTLTLIARAAGQSATVKGLTDWVEAAHQAVAELAAKLTPETGAGTTLVVGVVRDNRLNLVNVGDSRCYLQREGRVRCLTVDDTIENEIRRRRARGEDVEMDERYQNALSRCLGQPMPLEPEMHSIPLHKADMILFCSDGVSRMITDRRLGEIMGAPGPVADVLDLLIATAIEHGGHDNASAVLVRVAELGDLPTP
jgi:serine/threonine protein phosphatase PrpC